MADVTEWLIENLDYDSYIFNPARDDIEEVSTRLKMMRDRTLEFFERNQGLLEEEDGVIKETIGRYQRDRAAEIAMEDIRIRETLEPFFQEGFKDRIGDIYVGNKPPTAAIAATAEKSGKTACSQASLWRPLYGQEFNKDQFDEETLARKLQNQIEIKTVVIGKEIKVSAVLGGEETVAVAGDKRYKSNLASDQELEVVGLIPYTVNPMTVDKSPLRLEGMNISDSVRNLGEGKYITNNLGSRFLSFVAQALPAVEMIVDRAEQINARGAAIREAREAADRDRKRIEEENRERKKADKEKKKAAGGSSRKFDSSGIDREANNPELSQSDLIESAASMNLDGRNSPGSAPEVGASSKGGSPLIAKNIAKTTTL